MCMKGSVEYHKVHSLRSQMYCIQIPAVTLRQVFLRIILTCKVELKLLEIVGSYYYDNRKAILFRWSV